MVAPARAITQPGKPAAARTGVERIRVRSIRRFIVASQHRGQPAKTESPYAGSDFTGKSVPGPPARQDPGRRPQVCRSTSTDHQTHRVTAEIHHDRSVQAPTLRNRSARPARLRRPRATPAARADRRPRTPGTDVPLASTATFGDGPGARWQSAMAADGPGPDDCPRASDWGVRQRP